MSAIIEAKKQQVDTIAEQLKNSVSTVIVDYRGLTVAEVSLVDMSFAPGLPTTLHSFYSFIVFVAMLSLHRFHTARPATALFNAGISSFANSSMLRSQLSLSSQS